MSMKSKNKIIGLYRFTAPAAKLGAIVLFCSFTFSALAAPGLELIRLTDKAYAIVGELGNRSTENLANNATFGFVVTKAGVVLIDSGGGFAGAKALHTVIRRVTDQPVTHVINTGGWATTTSSGRVPPLLPAPLRCRTRRHAVGISFPAWPG